MADKLTYKGGTTVVGHAGDEMQLVLPAKGSFHRVPRWWNKKGTIAYVDSAVFLVTLDSGIKVRLIVPVTVGGQTLEIRHDGYGNFTFPIKGRTERVAVVAEEDYTLYKEYQFSKISGGSVLTRTLQPYPAPPAPPAPEPVVVVVPEPEPVVEEEPIVEDEPVVVEEVEEEVTEEAEEEVTEEEEEA